MKKTIVIILLICLHLSVVNAQQKTLDVDQRVKLVYEDQPLLKILDDLAYRYSIKFSYSKEKVLLTDEVTINLVNIPLSEGLSQLLKSFELDYRIIGDQIVLRKKKNVSQNSVRFLRGSIVDSISRMPIAMASVSVKNKSFGTVSNNEGVFEFLIPVSAEPDTVVVSFVGFESINIPLHTLSDQPLLILMQEKPVMLSEVTISAERLTAKAIFDKAFEDLEKNFSQKPFQLNGFFRQLSRENGKYVLLIESDIEIYDNAYTLNDNFNLQEKVAIRQSRVSKNYFEHQHQNFFDYHNNLKQLLVWNYSRYSNPYVMERTNFIIDTITSLNNRPVYVISSAMPKYTGEILEGTNCFTLHIDCETFAIYQIKNETMAQPGYYLPARPAFIKGDKSKLLKFTTASHTYSFRQYNGRMYLSDVRGFLEGKIVNVKDNSVDREVSSEELLMINEIRTDNIQAPSENLMDKKKGIVFQNTIYDSQFWNDYSQAKLVPLTAKQEQDLEGEIPLEEQFKLTGKKD
jgi:hypothetical protein